jgi:hypothetical protein
MAGLSQGIRGVYNAPAFPELQVRANMRRYLESVVKAHAASNPARGEIFLPDDESSTDPYLKYHEVAHCIQAALGAEIDEGFADGFAAAMVNAKARYDLDDYRKRGRLVDGF